MTGPDTTVHIVDDDPAVRDALSLLIQSVGLHGRAFATAREFLDAYEQEQGGCVVLDIRMPGMTGLELLDLLKARRISIPVIVVTGHGDVGSAVRAVKAGAFDFIEKPFQQNELLERITEAIRRDRNHRMADAARLQVLERLGQLTARERDVLDCLVEGAGNKEAARRLGISPRTVEVYRARMMQKLHAESLCQVVRMVMLCERQVPIAPPDDVEAHARSGLSLRKSP